MTLGEFKAWFEGFSESIEDRPNAKQWARIKDKIALIDGKTAEIHEVIRWIPSWSYPVYLSPYISNPIWQVSNTPARPITVTSSMLALAGQNEAQLLS